MMQKLINDIVGLSGFVLASYGLYKFSPALCFVVTGACLVGYALVNGIRLSRPTGKSE